MKYISAGIRCVCVYVCDRSMEGEILLTLILFFLGACSLYRVKLAKGSLAMIKVEK